MALPFMVSALISMVPTFAQDRPAGAGAELHQRAVFWGLAAGDATGALTETYTPEQIRRVFGRFSSLRDPLPLRRILELRGKKQYRRLRIPGYVTDDTQQAMALLLSFLQKPSATPVANPATGREEPVWDGLSTFAWMLINGSNADAWRGQGSSFNAAVKRLKNMVRLAEIDKNPGRHGLVDHFRLQRHLMNPHVKPHQIFDVRISGTRADSIGAAMRTTPLGALTAYPEELLETVVIQSSLVTHADVRAVAMAYAMFKATRMLIEQRPIAELRAELIAATWRVERRLLAMTDWPKNETDPHAVSRAMNEVFTRLARAKTNEQVSLLVERYGTPALFARRKDWYKFRKFTANSGVATLSGLHALALSLNDIVNPVGVMLYAVNFGDDTDTVAAMAGSLLGAREGSYWIDLEELADQKRLAKYADALVSGVSPETSDEYLAAEAHLTKNEREFQKSLPADPPGSACVNLLERLSSGEKALAPATDLFD